MAIEQGLSEIEAQRRLETDGPNEIQRSTARSLIRIVVDVVREPMFLLLFVAGGIYLLLGDFVEAMMMLGAVVATATISVVQEKRTDNVLESLRDLSSPRALVLRDGERKRIAGYEVVRGDVIVLAEGDRIPADAQLISGNNLQVDESLLTGESVAVDKLMPFNENAQEIPNVYSGSLVVRGHGLAQVYATGVNSELGKIGKALNDIPDEPTRLHIQTRQLVKLFGTIGLTLSLLVVLFYGLKDADWLKGGLTGITLAMAILPEEFPLVLTFFMAMGAWRISKNQVMTRHSATIETLGSATVLCTDKTGTLTLNKMAVSELRTPDQQWQFGSHLPLSSPQLCGVLEYAMLASERNPTDPMERAILTLADTHLKDPKYARSQRALVHEYGLTPELLAMTHVWQTEGSQEPALIATKGAPEAIFDLCHMGAEQAKEIRQAVNTMAAAGLRVLGVAKAKFEGTNWPINQLGFDFEFIGLLGLADPLRESVPKAVAQCQSAGIKVVMITGDYSLTAMAIASQAGIVGIEDQPRHMLMTGDELSLLTPDQLAARVGEIKVFARIKPEQKLLIVNALKSSGEIVAMTGDGVNDAPALKSAHIGIAMGQRGTDVAREAASMVLMQDDFDAIVKTIAQGRQIYDNIRKALAFVVSVHVPIAGMVVVPIVLGWPLLLFPAHVAFFELVIDPSCSFVFESEDAESDLMQRPPRPAVSTLFSYQQIMTSTLQGAAVLVSLMALIFELRSLGVQHDEIRAASFVAMILGSLLLAWHNLKSINANNQASLYSNRSFFIVLFASLLTLLLVNTVPVLQSLFKFANLTPLTLGLVCVSGALSYILIRLIRHLSRIDLLNIFKTRRSNLN